MTDHFANGLETLHRHPGAMLAAVAACVVAAGFGLRDIRFDTTLTTFFPPGSEATRSLTFLGDASLEGKVAISFGRDAATPEAVLHEAADRFAERAAKLPEIRNVLASVDSSSWQTGLSQFYELMPQWRSADDLEALKGRLNSDEVRTALKRRYGQLARPEGTFLAEAVRHDPLGLFDAPLAALGTGASKLGYDVVPDAGRRLMSRDGLHRLVLLDTTASVADLRASERLLQGIRSALADLPPGVRTDIVCGHAHSVANQSAIRHDLTVAGYISAAALAALLLFVYRDWRVAMTALVPLFALIVTLPVCSHVFGNVTFLAGAFGPVVAGLTVDYGIHVCRAGGRVRALLPPILAGMGTTFAVFVGFFASRAEGWRQVGCFGATAVVAALAFSICALPAWVRGARREAPAAFPDVRRPPALPLWARSFLTLALIGATCAGVARLRMDNDFSRLDGSGAAVFDAEKRFQDTWGEKDGARGILAVKVAKDAEADEVGAQLFEEVSAVLGRASVSGYASVAPSPKRRASNLAAWRAFWAADGRANRLQATVREEGAAFGFAANAFEPFFRMTSEPCDDTEKLGPLLTLLRSRFVLPAKSGGAYAAVYVPEDTESLSRLQPWLDQRTDVILVSRSGLPGAMARDFGADAARVIAVMACLLLVAALMALRSLKHVALSLLPCVAAVGSLFGALGLAGVPVNIAHVLAAMIVLGVTYDYGVFFLYESLGRLESQSRDDVRLCLLTTLAGSAPLLAAGHPVIFSIGLAMTIGIGAGFLTAAGLFFPPRRRFQP